MDRHKSRYKIMTILYQVFLYRKNRGYELTFKFSKNINTLIICMSIIYLTMVIVLPIEYSCLETGMCVLSGLLNSVYNIIAIMCNVLLILFITIKNKYLSNQFRV